MDCPICGAIAKNATPAEFDGLVVECKHCGAYEIADSALNSLLRLDIDGRRAALSKAAGLAAPGDKPMIELSCVS